jgi:hypothetical protein
MRLRHPSVTAWIIGIVLIAAQTLLIVHDAAPHSPDHTKQCQICTNGAASGYALPSAGVTFHPQLAGTLPSPPYLLSIPLSRYTIPAARSPPQKAFI